MTRTAYRTIQILLTLITLAVLIASFYFQYVKGLQPCPLCLMQRFCIFMLLMFGLMGLTLSTLKRARLVAVLQIVFAVAGVFFASRQLWLQSLPAGQTPACMPGLDVLIHYFPWQDVLRALVWGAGDCAEINWQWLGLSMPGWSLLYFLFMLVISALLFLRLKPTVNHLVR